MRVTALGLLLLLAVGTVASHQLTPFMLLLSVTVLVVSGRCWSTGLPVVLALVIGLWLTYPASAYLESHPIFSATLADPTPPALSEGLGSSAGHQRILEIRVLVIAALALLALAGLVRDLKAGHRDLRPVLLGAAPLPLLVAHSYGGEMVLRVALFWLPFAAYLAAGALLPPRDSLGPPYRLGPLTRAVVAFTVCGVLAVGSVFARYGNARFDMFTPQEVAATAALYRIAAPEELLLAGDHPTPWGYRDYDEHRRRTLTEVCLPGHDAATCHRLLRELVHEHGGEGLLLLTRANRASVRMQGDMLPSTLADLQRRIRASAGSSLLFTNRDARIYRLTTTPDGGAR